MNKPLNLFKPKAATSASGPVAYAAVKVTPKPNTDPVPPDTDDGLKAYKAAHSNDTVSGVVKQEPLKTPAPVPAPIAPNGKVDSSALDESQAMVFSKDGNAFTVIGVDKSSGCRMAIRAFRDGPPGVPSYGIRVRLGDFLDKAPTLKGSQPQINSYFDGMKIQWQGGSSTTEHRSLAGMVSFGYVVEESQRISVLLAQSGGFLKLYESLTSMFPGFTMLLDAATFHDHMVASVVEIVQPAPVDEGEPTMLMTLGNSYMMKPSVLTDTGWVLQGSKKPKAPEATTH